MNAVYSTNIFKRRTVLYGYGTLKGTVLDKSDAPLAREVQLWVANAPPEVLFRELLLKTISDEVTGAWEFPNLDQDQLFAVLALDSEGTYDPVLKVSLVPEPME